MTASRDTVEASQVWLWRHCITVIWYTELKSWDIGFWVLNRFEIAKHYRYHTLRWWHDPFDSVFLLCTKRLVIFHTWQLIFRRKKVAGEYLGGYHTMFLRRLHNCCRNWTSNVRSVSWREKHGKMKPGIQVDHNGIRVRWFAWNLRISDSTGSRSPTEWNGSRMWQLWTRHSITRMNHFLHDLLYMSLLTMQTCAKLDIYIYLYVYYINCLL